MGTYPKCRPLIYRGCCDLRALLDKLAIIWRSYFTWLHPGRRKSSPSRVSLLDSTRAIQHGSLTSRFRFPQILRGSANRAWTLMYIRSRTAFARKRVASLVGQQASVFEGQVSDKSGYSVKLSRVFVTKVHVIGKEVKIVAFCFPVQPNPSPPLPPRLLVDVSHLLCKTGTHA